MIECKKIKLTIFYQIQNQFSKYVSFLQGSLEDSSKAVNDIIYRMSQALANGDQIGVRKFGTFRVKTTQAQIRRNPKTGESVNVAARHLVHFKPGAILRERVNQFVTKSDDAN